VGETHALDGPLIFLIRARTHAVFLAPSTTIVKRGQSNQLLSSLIVSGKSKSEPNITIRAIILNKQEEANVYSTRVVPGPRRG
jgi:hypothetical protein